MPSNEPLTLDFSEIHMSDTSRVGGKNASLGELFNTFHEQGIGVLDGFATTAYGFRLFLRVLNLEGRLRKVFTDLDVDDVQKLSRAGLEARSLVRETPLPPELCGAALDAYERLCNRAGGKVELAVRSSATAEDLPEASFAGAAESFLNVRDQADLIEAIHLCFASLLRTGRSVIGRRSGYGQLQVALSVGVMPMVRSDKGSSGVLFTLDPESGFRDVTVINGVVGAWGICGSRERCDAGRMDDLQAFPGKGLLPDHRAEARNEAGLASSIRKDKGTRSEPTSSGVGPPAFS